MIKGWWHFPATTTCTIHLAACGGTFSDMINKIFLYSLYPEHPVYPVQKKEIPAIKLSQQELCQSGAQRHFPIIAVT